MAGCPLGSGNTTDCSEEGGGELLCVVLVWRSQPKSLVITNSIKAAGTSRTDVFRAWNCSAAVDCASLQKSPPTLSGRVCRPCLCTPQKGSVFQASSSPQSQYPPPPDVLIWYTKTHNQMTADSQLLCKVKGQGSPLSHQHLMFSCPLKRRCHSLTRYLCFLCALFWKQSMHRTQVGSIPQSLQWEQRMKSTEQQTVKCGAKSRVVCDVLPLSASTCTNMLVHPTWTLFHTAAAADPVPSTAWIQHLGLRYTGTFPVDGKGCASPCAPLSLGPHPCDYRILKAHTVPKSSSEPCLGHHFWSLQPDSVQERDHEVSKVTTPPTCESVIDRKAAVNTKFQYDNTLKTAHHKF